MSWSSGSAIKIIMIPWIHTSGVWVMMFMIMTLLGLGCCDSFFKGRLYSMYNMQFNVQSIDKLLVISIIRYQHAIMGI